MSPSQQCEIVAERPFEPGFTRSISPDIARLQVRMSLTLVAVLGLAIFALAASSRFIAAPRAMASQESQG